MQCALIATAFGKTLEHDPEKRALGLDPRVAAGFRKRSCFKNKRAVATDGTERSQEKLRHPELSWLRRRKTAALTKGGGGYFS
jgi:hypothetical protein